MILESTSSSGDLESPLQSVINIFTISHTILEFFRYLQRTVITHWKKLSNHSNTQRMYTSVLVHVELHAVDYVSWLVDKLVLLYKC